MHVFLLVLFVSSVNAVSLQDYCEDYVYEQFYRPRFYFNPKPYILPYFKRCINHDEFVDCIEQTREGHVPNVTVQPFEEQFPRKIDMTAAGIVLCDMNLHKLPPNITSCKVNRRKCENVKIKDDNCKAGFERARCVWREYQKCGAGRMAPIQKYEMGYLGGACLKQLGLHIKPFSYCEDKPKPAEGRVSSFQGSVTLIALSSVLVNLSFAKDIF